MSVFSKQYILEMYLGGINKFRVNVNNCRYPTLLCYPRNWEKCFMILVEGTSLDSSACFSSKTHPIKVTDKSFHCSSSWIFAIFTSIILIPSDFYHSSRWALNWIPEIKQIHLYQKGLQERLTLHKDRLSRSSTNLIKEGYPWEWS